MNILSIYYGHNATVSYQENGEMKYIIHEEKFNNIKNCGGAPIESLKHLRGIIDMSKVDRISIVNTSVYKDYWLAYKTNRGKSSPNSPTFNISFGNRVSYLIDKHFSFLFRFLNKINMKRMYSKDINWFCEELSGILGIEINESKLDFIDHHTCHALSPIYFYGLHNNSEPVLVFTLDGAGERYCATVNIWENGELKTISKTDFTNSLGYLWVRITQGLGMKGNEHEYKVMGLAAYTSEKYYMPVYDRLFKNLIEVDGLQLKSKIPLNKADIYLHNKFYGLRFDNIAGALQHLTEDVVLKWIRNGINETGIKNIALSGGVFMNVKLNKVIQEQDFIDKAYFMPSAGDDSNSIGAILGSYIKNNGNLSGLKELKSTYFGIEITDKNVRAFIKENNLNEKYTIEDIGSDEESSVKVANLLSKHETVAVCRGKGEWGARSLCNRAILSNASDLKNFHMINDMIKMRDFWMPFAPTILESWADKYILNWNKLKDRCKESCYYMITAFDSTQIAQEHLRAAIHQKDKSLRPQLVNENSNSWMFNTLKEYESLTGMGGVMNTSLNIHGYPLVGTMEQALFTLDNSGLKHLLLGNILISKK